MSCADMVILLKTVKGAQYYVFRPKTKKKHTFNQKYGGFVLRRV